MCVGGQYYFLENIMNLEQGFEGSQSGKPCELPWSKACQEEGKE